MDFDPIQNIRFDKLQKYATNWRNKNVLLLIDIITWIIKLRVYFKPLIILLRHYSQSKDESIGFAQGTLSEYIFLKITHLLLIIRNLQNGNT